MTDLVTALRSAFDAQPDASTPVDATALASARQSLKHATGQLEILRKSDPFTEAHAAALQAASQSLRRAARELEIVEAGIRDHLANGYSSWRGSAGAETPVLL
ncbi:MAG: hypothetical protein EBS05_11575 [Proteobacteria bacterium]|nr:hypothetical protein [Pseudomonadota bacterium]